MVLSGHAQRSNMAHRRRSWQARETAMQTGGSNLHPAKRNSASFSAFPFDISLEIEPRFRWQAYKAGMRNMQVETFRYNFSTIFTCPGSFTKGAPFIPVAC
jgi:hypothetical protein